MADISDFSDLFLENISDEEVFDMSTDHFMLQLNDISDEQLNCLIEPDRKYWNSLRTILAKICCYALAPGGHPKCSTYGHPNCSTRPVVT